MDLDAGGFNPTPNFSSTGPFAPTDEDIIRMLGLGVDLQIVHSGVFMATVSSNSPEKPKNLDELSTVENQIDSALDRVAKSTPFLSDRIKKIGEAGFELALAHAELKDLQILVMILEKAGREGGFVPMLETRLNDFPKAFSDERARMKSVFDTFRKNGEIREPLSSDASHSGSLFLCCLGAAEMAGGASLIGAAIVGTVVTGGLAAPKGAVVAIGGSALLGSGTALVATQC